MSLTNFLRSLVTRDDAAEPGCWVLAVGVLEWARPDHWDPFEQEGRRDARLVQVLRDRGIPADHVFYLQDRAATRSAIEGALETILQKAGPGDTLIVYYAGHGYLNEDGRFFFAPYDGGDEDDSYWSGGQLVRTIADRFRGDTCWLLADCCHSGALTNHVRDLQSRVGFGTLTSTVESESSTGNWSFTEALLEGMSGNPLADRDGDGQISFFELGAFVAGRMDFAEGQQATSATSGSFSSDAPVARVSREARTGEDETAEVEYDGEWYRALILERKGDQFRIRYTGYDDWPEEWVPLSRVRDLKDRSRFPVGCQVEIEWDGEWYPGVILKHGADGRHYVHYDGYPDSDDQWVGPQRLRPPTRG